MTIALLLLLATPAPAVQWYSDFDLALKAAQEEKKRVFTYVLDGI